MMAAKVSVLIGGNEGSNTDDLLTNVDPHLTRLGNQEEVGKVNETINRLEPRYPTSTSDYFNALIEKMF